MNKHKIKILNLYAGIGGNRKLWKNVEVTAIENNKEIAAEYQRSFPDDEVLTEDAHEFLLWNYQDYDFIWTSPPCQSHTDMNYVLHAQKIRRYTELNQLFGEIIHLSLYAKKQKWVVENVKLQYRKILNPLVLPTFTLSRHYYWSNFTVISNDKKSDDKNKYFKAPRDSGKKRSDKSHYVGGSPHERGTVESFEKSLEIKISDKFKGNKIQILRNCVHPQDGLFIFQSAFEQQSLEEWL